jgi:hypothetical protein
VENEVQHSILILGPKPPYRNIAFFIIMLFSRLLVRIDILITRGKHLHDSIVLQGGEWGHNTRLVPTLCIAVTFSIHTSERSCCFVLKVSVFLFLRYTHLIVHSSVSSNVYHVIWYSYCYTVACFDLREYHVFNFPAVQYALHVVQ